jgi:plastocyanin
MRSFDVRLALGLVLVATGCSGASDDNPASAAPSTTVAVTEGSVVIRDIAYHPSRVTAAAGKELVWSWDDRGITHSVTADDGSFDSGRRTEGAFRRAFDRPGEFAYHCEVHARMKGAVVVTPPQ